METAEQSLPVNTLVVRVPIDPSFFSRHLLQVNLVSARLSSIRLAAGTWLMCRSPNQPLLSTKVREVVSYHDAVATDSSFLANWDRIPRPHELNFFTRTSASSAIRHIWSVPRFSEGLSIRKAITSLGFFFSIRSFRLRPAPLPSSSHLA